MYSSQRASCQRAGRFVFTISAILCAVASSHAGEPNGRRVDFAIAIHGGTRGRLADITAEQQAAQKQSLKRALAVGTKILRDGGSSLDAVEQTIRFLEDDPLFNAGRGAVFNHEGGHELDASIMDGRDKSCGAVAGVTTVKNPVRLARLVMTHTPHVLLAGSGAEQFADEMKVERVDQKYFSIQPRYDAWQRALHKSKPRSEPPRGTVGCVALDRHGNLAAGTSTGGLTDKRFGRIGDSPIIGAGTYADNQTCAVSCTGIGEHFIRNASAYDVAALMKYRNLQLAQAVSTVIHRTLRPGDGGMIAISHDGSIAMDFNTPGMARAAADSLGRHEVKLGK